MKKKHQIRARKDAIRLREKRQRRQASEHKQAYNVRQKRKRTHYLY